MRFGRPSTSLASPISIQLLLLLACLIDSQALCTQFYPRLGCVCDDAGLVASHCRCR